jgi:hypothetical protein
MIAAWSSQAGGAKEHITCRETPIITALIGTKEVDRAESDLPENTRVVRVLAVGTESFGLGFG